MFKKGNSNNNLEKILQTKKERSILFQKFCYIINNSKNSIPLSEVAKELRWN